MTKAMTLEHLIIHAKERDGWHLSDGGLLRNSFSECPLEAVFGIGYQTKGRLAGLDVGLIMYAADNIHPEYPNAGAMRQRLITDLINEEGHDE